MTIMHVLLFVLHVSMVREGNSNAGVGAGSLVVVNALHECVVCDERSV